MILKIFKTSLGQTSYKSLLRTSSFLMSNDDDNKSNLPLIQRDLASLSEKLARRIKDKNNLLRPHKKSLRRVQKSKIVNRSLKMQLGFQNSNVSLGQRAQSHSKSPLKPRRKEKSQKNHSPLIKLLSSLNRVLNSQWKTKLKAKKDQNHQALRNLKEILLA